MEEKKFIKKLHEFSKERHEQKLRGLNDYNPLTTVLNYHDEVRLHSRMIGSLLDINGAHYQGTLFLKEFLKELNLQNFVNLDKTTVKVEHKDIDLYITDGDKHIIIENKIWADDQPCQIIKYVNIIVQENLNAFKTLKENDKINEDLLRVVYLSPKEKDPDEHVIRNKYITFSGGEEKLSECSEKEHTKEYVPESLKNYKVKYQRIAYKKEILNWLKKSQEEVSNITNLNSAIQYYINAVKEVVGEYKSSIKQYKDFFFVNQNIYETFLKMNEEKKQIIFDDNDLEDEKSLIESGFNEAREQLFNNFFEKLLSPVLDDVLRYKKYNENLTASGRVNSDGSIVLLALHETYDVRLYFKNNKFSTISIGMNNDLDLSDNQKSNINTKLNKLKEIDTKENRITYITGKTKGKSLVANYIIPKRSIDNLFKVFSNNETIDKDLQNNIQEHIESIKKILES